MRKRLVNHIADTGFWYVLYFLPVLAFLIYMFSLESGAVTLIGFNEFLQAIGFSFVLDNPLSSIFADIFGANGLMPIFQTNDIFNIFAWYISVYLCHICVDLFLLLPRITHKFMNKFTKE